MPDEIPRSVRDRIYAEQEHLLEDDLGRAVRTILDAGVDDRFSRELLQKRVATHKIAQAFAGPFPIPRLDQGEIVLGRDGRGGLVRCPLQYLNAHGLTVASSGAGKTTKSLFYALQIARHVRGMWLLDLRKSEFRKLRPLLKRLGVDLVVVPADALKLNPMQPPEGVPALDWAPRLADLLVCVLQLPQRAAKLLHATAVLLYRGAGSSHPTLYDLREAIAADENANAQAKSAVLDALDRVLLSIGPIFRYRLGWKASDLARRHLVLELGGLAGVDRDLIVNYLLQAEFSGRLARGISNTRMDLWICADECGRMISASNPSGGITDALALVRGAGVGLDLSVQSGDIHPSVLSNTAFKCIGRAGNANDLDVIGSAMGLTADQRRWISLNLVPGTFVGQVGEGAWRRPFVFTIPPMRQTGSPPEANQPLKDLPALPG